MDKVEFEKAFDGPKNKPTTQELKKRFDEAFKQTHDIHTAMAAVNELLDEPITHEELLERMEPEIGA